MDTLNKLIEQPEIFKQGTFSVTNSEKKEVRLRYFILIEKNIIESGILYSILQPHYPEIENYKSLLQTFIQAHRFNVGQFGEKERKDNPIKKNRVKLDPKYFNPENLPELGLPSSSFEYRNFSDEDVEKLFNLFKPRKYENILLDEIIYRELPKFNLSKKGYIKYLVKVFNSVYNIWLEKSIKSFEELKLRVVEIDAIEEDEKDAYLKIKEKFLNLFNITDKVYSIEAAQITEDKQDQLKEIKSEIENKLNKSLIGLRRGKVKEFYNNLLDQLKGFDDKSVHEKVDSLIKIFDEFYDNRVLYIHLSRRLEKFYNIIIGRFCRIILPSLIHQEKLSREEIRLFVLMNVPLNVFNYHRTFEPLIRQFTSYENYLERFLNIVIFRRRTHQQLNDFMLLFNSYLKTYLTILTLRRDQDKTSRKKARSKEDRMKDGQEIDNIDYDGTFGNKPVKIKKKTGEDLGDENDSTNDDDLNIENDVKNEDENIESQNDLLNDEEEYFEQDIFSENDEEPENDKNIPASVSGEWRRYLELDLESDELQEEKDSQKSRISKKVANPNKLEYSIKEIETSEFLTHYNFNEKELSIIRYKIDKLTDKQIGELLEPRVSKQAVNKIWLKITQKFPSERDLYQLLMD